MDGAENCLRNPSDDKFWIGVGDLREWKIIANFAG